MSSRSRRTVATSLTEFESFFQGWLIRQEHFLEELRSALQACDTLKDEELRDLISCVLAHYQQYYEQKSRIANHDVLLVFSPPWFSSVEQCHFWIAGFKPALAFRIVHESVKDLSTEQMERLERLMAETKAEEKELETELARIQESVTVPSIVEVVRGIGDRESSLVDVNRDGIKSVMHNWMTEMEMVLANADMLRSRTAERVVEILTPVQNLKFLAAATELQLTMRIWGSQIDGERRR